LQTMKIAVSKFKKDVRLIVRRYKAVRKYAAVSFVTLAMCALIVAFMTGVLYFKNDLFINDGGVVKQAFSMNDGLYDILTELNYEIGEFDRVSFSGIYNSKGTITIQRGFGVNVIADGKEYTVGAIEGESAETVLSYAGIAVNKYDVVLYEGSEIMVIRGFGVDVTADGLTVTVGTTGGTVADIIKKAGVILGENDIVNMDIDAKVREGDSISVNRVLYRERTDIELVPYETTTYYSNLLGVDEKEVIPGVNGEIERVYYEKLVDGVVVTSEVLSETTLSDPVTEIVTKGKALKTPYSKRDFAEINLENGLPVDYLYVVSGKSTAYNAYDGDGTASGRKLQIGTVAVDPKVIPYGSLLYIVSADGKRVYGAAVAADTGGFVGSDIVVDLYMGTFAEHFDDSCNWGARQVNIYVISEGVY